MSTTPTFHAGICMAGAVSAGAYTAGVMDYLTEALENWQKAKTLQEQGKLSGIPKHNFLIEVLGGASAGGMTAAISARGLQENFEPVNQHNVNQPGIAEANPFYNAWVNLKETVADDMMSVLLNTDDIEKDSSNLNKEVRAGFNSNFIRDIASDLIDRPLLHKYDRPYVAKDLDVFTTLTNLRGFAYDVTFITANGIRRHRMRMHRDYAFFTLGEDKHDGRIPLRFTEGHDTLQMLKSAAMGTGAFPVGLESRELSRQSSYIMNSKYLNLMKNKENVHYALIPGGDSFESLNVDGGVINNEPYEITESLMEDRQHGRDLKRSASAFDSLVLMIDPFPNDEEAEPDYKVRKAWKHVLPEILGAMRGQLMLKDAEIERAYMEDDYTRFLLMPERFDEHNQRQKYTIACGALGGFSGFLSKEFRSHDYFLGRRNCQRFLQKYFTAPLYANNPILTFGYENVTETGITTNSKGEKYLCLLPDIRITGNDATGYSIVAPQEECMCAYPKLNISYITGLKKKIVKRVESVIDNIANEQVDATHENIEPQKGDAYVLAQHFRKKSWISRIADKYIKSPLTTLYLKVGKKGVKNIASDFAIESIIKDLAERKLIKDDVYGTGIGND